MWPYIHFRVVRRWRRLQRWIQHHAEAASVFARLYIFGKGRQLALVRRTVIAWWVVIAVCGYGLISQTQAQQVAYRIPQGLSGGTYSEGVVGAITGVNPIIFTGGASADASKLVFSGLTQINNEGKLVGDLAERWEVTPDGKTYTFHLRKNVKWHDGQPVTAKDVEFTVIAIQTPDTRSPLAASWQGVRAEAVDDTTVRFVLPAAYTPFINITTQGIIPRHLLEGVDPTLMARADFNRAPVGTGPYKAKPFKSGDSEVILSANDDYFGGEPRMEKVVLHAYETPADMLDGYARRQVDAISRLQPNQLEKASIYDDLEVKELTSPDMVGAFFKTTAPLLSDKAVRHALSAATDRGSILRDQLNGHARLVRGPLLPGALGYVGSASQASFNLESAKAELDKVGWIVGEGGIRSNKGQKLSLTLATQQDRYGDVAQAIAKQWKEVGVDVKVIAVDSEELQQNYIRPRKYDVLLYGVNLGADADGYPFWHSSRASDPGLNLSVYNSKEADRALESGRTSRDEALRAAKYKAFVAAWVADTPAVMLYSPNYLYGLNDDIGGFKSRSIIDPADRLYDIQNRTVRSRLVDRPQ